MAVIKDNLTLDGIKQKLSAEMYNLSLLEETDSTNNYLKALARKGEKEGKVIIADRQTGGRGRFNRRFYSPQGCGIYMSILLKPDLSPENVVLITAAAAVAVSRAVIKLTGESVSIKWVNDVLKNGKKICGILTEGAIDSDTGKFAWAVLGIGINTYTPANDFESEIKNIAGAVFDTTEQGLRNRLCAQILNEFYTVYTNLQSVNFLEDYRKYSCVLGETVSVVKNERLIPAKALEIDDNCRLLVEYQDGKKEFLNSGEISIKI